MKKTNNKLQVTIKLTKQSNAFGSNYEKMFLQTAIMKKRGDKSFYVRAKYHERLVGIQRFIGNDNIALYVYLDKILKHHFEIFDGLLIAGFNKNAKPIL